jgi:ADP-ribose pyrophosphatase
VRGTPLVPDCGCTHPGYHLCFRDMTTGNPETNILKRAEIYRGKIVTLQVDTIQLPSGKTSVREVVHHPGGVVAVPVMDDGRLLLIRQFRYPLQRYILEFPAGKLDGPQSPLDTIKRELEEETGYRAEIVTHECSFFTSPGISDELIHLFVARGLTPVPQRLEEGEHITVETYTPDECWQMLLNGGIVDGKTLLGILWLRMKIVK